LTPKSTPYCCTNSRTASIGYLANRGATPRALADLIAFNNNEREREMPIFGQELFVDAQAKGPLTDMDYVEAHERAKQLATVEGIDAVLAKGVTTQLPLSGAKSGTLDIVSGILEMRFTWIPCQGCLGVCFE